MNVQEELRERIIGHLGYIVMFTERFKMRVEFIHALLVGFVCKLCDALFELQDIK